ncbi:ATP-dependent zinc metalloprotease FtsH [Gimesia chilikensis]|jgi:cell division protease FtsH|uniref:ATP-dependent zinc metalloprotease FtsH n=1 Tax=Gimesia chilikensis TaxID=2605989 RepID=A0A517PWG8_9PLAN|nr:ATP-dependent zinc metalloprotease FtsH [Gimesia chilikensis]QDT23712.1 ATP-dependent zinc metalloprotease FtsH 4 [Gimesia chilikensis]
MPNLDPKQSNRRERPTPPERNPKGDGRRPEPKGPKSNALWYLVVGGLILFITLSVVSNNKRGEKIKFGDFVKGLDDGKYNKTNVHELKFGTDYIVFQDQPKQEGSEKGTLANTTKNYYIPVWGIPQEARAQLQTKLENKSIIVDSESRPSEWESLIAVLFFPVVLLIFVIYLFRRMGGAGSPMSFGRSRGRMYAQDDIEVTFNDVAGIEEAVEELREVVEFLKTPAKYQALGGRIPKGVLLVGPPGTGKTMLAKAVAGEAGVPFYGLSGSDFVEMFVGVGAARVRDMFQQAAQRSPAIIFIDELDALGKTRGSGMPGGHDEREQTLNALLVEMDGFGSDQSVIVMGATNRPETLDPALMRPGRFDRHVLVDRPDVRGREAILKVHSAKVKMDESVNLQHIAKITPGFVGADLANLINEAALLAARNNKEAVTMRECEEGVERVVAGLEKSTRLIHEDEKNRVAYHECGHALVACSLPNVDPVHKISIVPRGLGALGYTLQRPEEEKQLVTQSELENRICVLLGGIAAEEIIYQETSTGAQNDLQRATDLARRMVTEFGMSAKLGRVHYSETRRSPFLGDTSSGSESIHSENTLREIDLEIRRIIDQCAKIAYEVLDERRELLEHLTQELLECEVMDMDQLQSILKQHQRGPQIKPGTFVDNSAENKTAEKDKEEPASDNDQSTDGTGT